jgi:hypothetical protein
MCKCGKNCCNNDVYVKAAPGDVKVVEDDYGVHLYIRKIEVKVDIRNGIASVNTAELPEYIDVKLVDYYNL